MPKEQGEAKVFGRPHTPLYAAQHAARYERQRLIREYEVRYDCRLVVLIGPLLEDSVTYFEELLVELDQEDDLHLLLVSPGGYGEVAIRLVRQAQARCRIFTVLVPTQAKSAATLLALGAHRIVMGPMSDLGPVDPQFLAAGGEHDTDRLVAAKDILAAWDRALDAVAARPDGYPVIAASLRGVDALLVEEARAALERTESQMREALASNPDRVEQEVDKLTEALKGPLIEETARHDELFSAKDAARRGLPIQEADLNGDQWRRVWQLWVAYFELDAEWVFESAVASQVVP